MKTFILTSLIFFGFTATAGQAAANVNFEVGENLILKSDANSHFNVRVIGLNEDKTVDVFNNDEPNSKFSILKGINPSNLEKPIKSIASITAGDRVVVVYGRGHWEGTVMAVYRDETADIYYAAQNYTYKSVSIAKLRHPITSLDGISVGAKIKMKFSDGSVDDVKVLAVYEDKTADVLYLKNGYVYYDIDFAFLK